uniref:Ribosomal protein S2 n=1 Tax=Nitzschia palea TaxID=303400 RepID=A0A2Z5ZBX9_9STRA|nr:ribosomal protein S2 [Nitzschia palea]
MKLKKFKFKQVLKLHLLNSKIYEHGTKKKNSVFLTDLNLTKTISEFKKSLNVIFEYHQLNKKILFVGLPPKLELKINQRTQHAAVDRNFELQSLLTNNLKSFKFSKGAKQLSFKDYLKLSLVKFSQKPDLIVLLAHEKKQKVIIENNLAKIPLIIFNSSDCLEDNSFNGFYNVTGFHENLVSTSEKTLLFLGLNFLFKRFKRKS